MLLLGLTQCSGCGMLLWLPVWHQMIHGINGFVFSLQRVGSRFLYEGQSNGRNNKLATPFRQAKGLDLFAWKRKHSEPTKSITTISLEEILLSSNFNKKEDEQRHQGNDDKKSSGVKNIVEEPVEQTASTNEAMDSNSSVCLGIKESAIHNYFMELALEEAQSAAQRGEVPVGAIVVQNFTQPTNESLDVATEVYFQILARASNQVEARYNAAAHAELLALQAAAQVQQNWRLYNTTLYTTLEPCVMCCAAAQAFRIDQIVYGAPDVRLGATGGRQASDSESVESRPFDLLTAAPHPFHNISNVVRGIQRESCAHELQNFFRQRRKQQQMEKKERKKMQEQLVLERDQTSKLSTLAPALASGQANRERWTRLFHKLGEGMKFWKWLSSSSRKNP
mmetsp:Transcript_26719/g.55943  ORF Transcript_26719/g.55943 Transcript_26719/m.55943 type:complete len:394 (-) Transcript_26719:673-1854(-)